MTKEIPEIVRGFENRYTLGVTSVHIPVVENNRYFLFVALEAFRKLGLAFFPFYYFLDSARS